MNPNCRHQHPNTPSLTLALHPPICLPCTQANLANPTLLPTLRHAAAASLHALSQSPGALLRAAPHAPDILHHLLRTHISLPAAHDPSFAAALLSAAAALAPAFDLLAAPPPRSYPLLEMSLSFAVDGVLGDACGRALAARALAKLLSAARDARGLRAEPVLAALRAALAPRAAPLLPALLELLPDSAGLFRDVAAVASPVLAVARPSDVDACFIVGCVERAMPPRRDVHADGLFLAFVRELVTRAVDVGVVGRGLAWDVAGVGAALVRCREFEGVVKRAVLAEEVELRATVTRVVCALCEAASGVAQHFCACDVFDYVVESIRSTIREGDNLSAEKKDLLRLSIESLAAVVDQRPPGLPQKWCYCLDVVLSVCEHLSDGVHAQRTSRILEHAFLHAPVPVFSPQFIDQFVAFEMMICTRMFQARQNDFGDTEQGCEGDDASQYEAVLIRGIECFTHLFQRYRPVASSIHSVLRICEATVQPKTHLSCVFALLVQLVGQFKAVLKVGKDVDWKDTREGQNLGQRLLYIIFDSWAGELEGDLENLETVLETESSRDLLQLAMNMFASALDPVFVECGSCSGNDQNGMRSWCWKYLPPRVAFSLSPEAGRVLPNETEVPDESGASAAAQMYLGRISLEFTETEEENIPAMPTTEESFLDSLAALEGLGAASFQLFEKAMEFDFLDGLCSPVLLADALSARLQKASSSAQSTTVTAHCLQIVRGISFICSRYGLQFRLLGLLPNVLESVIQNEGYCLSNPRDFEVFQQTILRGTHCSVDVLAWDKFADFFHMLQDHNGPEKQALWRLLVENRQVIKSVMFALSNSSSPQRIADCLLEVAETQEASSMLINSFEEGDAHDVLCTILRRLHCEPPAANKMTEVENNQSCYELECERASAFILILSRAATASASATNWNLLRVACETFLREVASTNRNSCSWSLLSSLLRLLVASLNNAEDEKVRFYIQQSGVPTEVTRMLRQSYGLGMAQDLFSSAAACLLLMLLNSKHPLLGNECLTKLLSDLLLDKNAWERLLSSFSLSTIRDRAYKVTNFCFLLNSLLLRKRHRTQAIDTLNSPEIAILLSAAAASGDVILEEAALRVLSTMMELETTLFSSLRSSFTHIQLSFRQMNKICSPNIVGSMTDVEVNYVQASVSCGHMDDNLHMLQQIVLLWLQERQHTLGAENDEVPTDKMLRSMFALSRVLERRFTEVGKAVPVLPSGHAGGVTKLPLTIKQDVTEVCDRTPQILLSRYSTLWRG